ncbi:hypothetical protein EN828_27110 [Mesorhizobium sp. M2D.F.Ca.ET.185.01.1.1]|uniref:hypothetical protein n=1 Tax=unclassified Mesorhizobium TaxID=325217 RepID=UPI000FCBB6C5|nr:MULTISPECIES: hypothetical protein [unclassified Mesorhizobium]TGP74754.1 hypothetical protein EN870_26140 [bacterium M00.F.Ca.ET.227.01.1.1]TGP84649.1 hypothetical protein EN864_28945 [bacterium M00.F.Ca.ET.221.01.1.1]TGP87708.1 hypothetical protein EN865_28245 [bacterium M00.F.Ca.ET.222.01.1.1]TGT97120.1 hypothetical protein EN806_50105 [bacterium M00.F.Ca.ET.163.01.1.1]TGU21755.1 hypothetical protein EN799_53010 [bacterium M00.F.Ca.ET.156.01.1.1]TGU42819.1 hypothetical protein EN789_306
MPRADAGKAASRKSAGAKPARSKPAGVQTAARPKRLRKTLVDDFAAALRADFRAHGAGVIAAVRAEKPEQYLKVVLTLLPKDFSASSESVDADKTSLEQLSDEEIRSRIRGLEANLRPFLDSDAGVSGAARGDGPAPSS